MKKKILFIGAFSDRGVDTYVKNVCDGINKDRYSVSVFNFSKVKSTEMINAIKLTGGCIYEIDVMHLKNSWHRRIYGLRKLFLFLRKKVNYDLIEVQSGSISELASVLFLCRLCRQKKVILHSHTSVEEYEAPKILQFLLKKEIKKASYYFSCSDTATDFSFPGIDKSKVVFIPNGIDTTKYKFNEESRNRLRKEYNITGKFVIGNVGAFEYPKNHEFILDVLDKCIKIRNDVHLLLIGKGELKDKIIKKSKDMNINEHITFIDYTDDIASYLSAMDIFILPSRYEGLPIALLEAQASGLICFVSSIIDKRSLITDNTYSFEAVNEKTFKWAEYICNTKRLVNRYDDNEVMNNSVFSKRNMIKIVEKEYDKILNYEE